MVIFDTIWPATIIYMKVAGNKEVVSMDIREAIATAKNVEYDQERSLALSEKEGQSIVSFVCDKEKEDGTLEKGKRFDMPVSSLAAKLEQDIYDGKAKITALAIQPEGLLLQPEVKQLLEQ